MISELQIFGVLLILGAIKLLYNNFGKFKLFVSVFIFLISLCGLMFVFNQLDKGLAAISLIIIFGLVTVGYDRDPLNSVNILPFLRILKLGLLGRLIFIIFVTFVSYVFISISLNLLNHSVPIIDPPIFVLSFILSIISIYPWTKVSV